MQTSQIIPALDLIDGQVVRLHQGDYAKQTTYCDDPIAQFADYVRQGAQQLHLVDLTGAKNPHARQTALIRQIIAATPCPVQVGGGIRREQDVADLLAAGANRVVIGSTAIKERTIVKQWFAQYGAEKFVLALDININARGQKIVAISGWQEASGVLLEEVIEDYQSVGYTMCYAPIFRVMAPWQAQTSIYIVKSARNIPIFNSNHRAALVAWQILRRLKIPAWQVLLLDAPCWKANLM